MARILQIASLLFLCTVMLYAQKPETSFDDKLKRGDTLVFQSKFDEAIDLYENMMQSQFLDALGKVILLNKLSSVYGYNQQYDKALEYGQQAQRESVQIGSKSNEAEALDNIASVYTFQRIDLNEAMEMSHNALNLKTKYNPNDSLAIAYSHYNIARILIANGLYNDALKKIESSLLLTPETSILAKKLKMSCWYGLGVVYYFLGKHDESLKWPNKILKSSNEKGEFHISVYNLLGSIYSSKSQDYKAILYYNKALNLSIQHFGHNHIDQASMYFNIGYSYYLIGDNDKTIVNVQKSLNMYINTYGTDHIFLFNHYLLLGETYGKEKGLAYLNKALEIIQNNEALNNWKIVLVYSEISEIYYNMNLFDKALEFAKKAIEIHESSNENTLDIVSDYISVALIYIKLKDFSESLKFIEKALAINKIDKDLVFKEDSIYFINDYIDSYRLLISLKTKGQIFLERYKTSNNLSDLAKSESIYEQTLSLLNKLRKTQRINDDQIAFSETAKSIYAQNIEVNLLLNEFKQDERLLQTAFKYSEESKGYTLAHIINQDEAKQVLNLPKSVLHTENKIDSTLAHIQSEIVKVKSASVIDSTQLYHWEGKLLELNQKKDSLEDAIETQYPKYHDLKYAKRTLTVPQIQEQLDDHTTFLEFFKSETTLYVFILTNTSFHVYNIESPDLDTQIESFQKSIKTRHEKDYYQKAYQLYEQLIAPFRKHLVGDQLIIVPDASLWHLPFDILLTQPYDQKSQQSPFYVLKDFAISYANSAHFLFQNPKEVTSRSKLLDECIAFSYKAKDSTLPIKDNEVLSLRTLRNAKIDLPGTRKEIEVLSQIYDGQYYYDSQANEVNFKKEAQHYSIVHLALHGDIDNRDPRNSMLYFSPPKEDTREDNILYNHELFALDIPADLVVLSACNTGTGLLNSGEGIASLGQAFQYAGTKSLLLSKWEVSDKTAPEIMKGFYSYLEQGMAKSKALQKAKLDFLSTSDDFTKAPFYWANFYLLGDSKALENQHTPFLQNIIYVLLLVLIIVMVYRLYYRQKVVTK